MPRFTIASLCLFAASVGFAQEKKDASFFDPDEAIVEIQKNRQQMIDLLKPIRKRADAEKAAVKLAECGDRVVALEKALGQFEAKLYGNDKRDYTEAMVKKHWSRQQEIKKDFSKALVRLQLEWPDAFQPLKDNALFKQYHDDCVESVRATFFAFDRNIKTYIETTGAPPKSLKKVNESVFSNIGTESILDPWGRPYRYDPDGKQNGGKKPDIWMIDPVDGKTLIGNWQK